MVWGTPHSSNLIKTMFLFDSTSHTHYSNNVFVDTLISITTAGKDVPAPLYMQNSTCFLMQRFNNQTRNIKTNACRANESLMWLGELNNTGGTTWLLLYAFQLSITTGTHSARIPPYTDHEYQATSCRMSRCRPTAFILNQTIRAWDDRRGNNTLLSLTRIRHCEVT